MNIAAGARNKHQKCAVEGGYALIELDSMI
jgi:hypothetical protein